MAAKGTRGRSSKKNGDLSTLSDRQRRIMEVIRDAIILRGYAPTIREIGDACGLTSTSSVAYHLNQLEAKGFLKRDPNKPRAVDVRHLENQGFGPKQSKPATQTAQADAEALGESAVSPTYIPVVGQIAAGAPILAEENIDEYYPMPSSLVGDGELYMLQVVGDSMLDAGILPGDWVVVRSQASADNGDFVAALLDGEATVKEFHQDSSGTWLLPHNSTAGYSPINGDSAEIMGKVVSVMRKL